MSYRIGSFNIQNFSRMSVFRTATTDSRKNLDAIASIIRDNEFDIIAIQEILHKEALKELLEKISSQYAEDCLKRGSKELGSNNITSRTRDSYGYRTKHWEGRWAKPGSDFAIKTDSISEGYAFIWNRDRIQLVTNSEGKAFEPRIADFDGAQSLARPPFIGRFMPKNARYEFRLINTHIVYSTPANILNGIMDDQNGDDSFVGSADVQLRKNEFNTLVKSLYVSYSEMMYDKTRHDQNARCLVPYTFLLGDYNLNRSDSKSKSAAKLTPDMESIDLISNGQLKLKTVNSNLTTLKGKPQDDNLATIMRDDPVIEHHLANNYDHFTYDANRLVVHQIAEPDCGVIMAFEQFRDTDGNSCYEVYKDSVSDHLPIYIDFDIKKRI